MTLTFGSLFAGIGGIDLGLERAGMKCKWQVEYNDYCNRILEKHWPDVKRFGDIRNLDRSTLEPVDLICGGFPCQPFSVAGQRKGTDDSRWLWPEFAKTIRQVKPRWVLVENVPGLLSIDTGRAFAGILRELAEMGYDAWWGSLRASDVGAPHRRERAFIVAHTQQHGRRRGNNGDAGRGSGALQTKRSCTGDESGVLADPDSIMSGYGNNGNEQTLGNSEESRTSGSQLQTGEWWAIEPNVGRVANGIPSRVDRLRGLGNAVVPQMAEWIGHCIMQAEATA